MSIKLIFYESADIKEILTEELVLFILRRCSPEASEGIRANGDLIVENETAAIWGGNDRRVEWAFAQQKRVVRGVIGFETRQIFHMDSGLILIGRMADQYSF